MAYELSINKPCHTRDLRCLDFYGGLLATGGSDKLVKLYSAKDGKIEDICTANCFQKNILSIKINRKGGSEIAVLAGCADGKIFGLDHLGNPIALFEHNSQISSLDFINSDYFVSGSWDGKAIVWQISTHKQIAQYANHKHAVTVFYNELDDEVVSSSQDKALASWSWKDGKQRRRKQGAHNDIVRQITRVEGVGLITCSNDETLKIWTSELQQISHLTNAHSAYVFTVKSLGLGSYFSAGDDKSIKVWKNQTVAQSLQCPAPVWSIALDETGDIYAGCSDGYLRVFSTNPQRKAAHNIIEAYNKQILDSASKKSGMSAQQISKLQTTADMARMSGKKDGQIRVFKNGLIPEAYMWQNGKWQKIGEVITENAQSDGGVAQSKYYPGDKYFEAGDYDYIFDVDDESGTRKQIPFNDGANALEASEKYCMREGLSKGYIEQIRKFLMANSSKIPRKAIQASKKQVPQSSLKCTPCCIQIQFADIKNPQALYNKITEFNTNLPVNLKLNDRQLQHCNRISIALENKKNYHGVKLDFKEIDTIKKVLQWPIQYKLPVWDLFRAFLCHYQSQTFFSGLDAGFEIVSQLVNALDKQNSQAFYALVFRTLANTMIQNTNKNALVKHGNYIFNQVEHFVQKNLTNKNLHTAIAAFLFNFTTTVIGKNIENEQVINIFIKVLRRRLQSGESEQNVLTLLQAASNIAFKFQNKRGDLQFVKNYLGNNDVSDDLRLLLQ